MAENFKLGHYPNFGAAERPCSQITNVDNRCRAGSPNRSSLRARPREVSVSAACQPSARATRSLFPALLLPFRARDSHPLRAQDNAATPKAPARHFFARPRPHRRTIASTSFPARGVPAAPSHPRPAVPNRHVLVLERSHRHFLAAFPTAALRYVQRRCHKPPDHRLYGSGHQFVYRFSVTWPSHLCFSSTRRRIYFVRSPSPSRCRSPSPRPAIPARPLLVPPESRPLSCCVSHRCLRYVQRRRHHAANHRLTIRAIGSSIACHG